MIPPRRDALFLHILYWLAIPLLLLWPLAFLITAIGARDTAQVPYDRALGNTLLLLAQQVEQAGDTPNLELSSAVSALLRGDETDVMSYRVTTGDGRTLAGDPDVPLPELARPLPGILQFRDDTLHGLDVRIAHLWLESGSPGTPPRLLQVAETLGKREQLSRQVMHGSIGPQLVILPLALLMIWLGLKRGLRPLQSLQTRLLTRRPDDATPLATDNVPREILPLVQALNDLLARQGATVDSQRRFVANAAHQLKTPLAGMRTQAELALRAANPEDRDRCLNNVIDGAERATRLVNQMLALARAESQPAEALAEGPVDLVEVAREQTSRHVPAAMDRHIDLGLEAEPTELWFTGNAVLLGELLGNLLDNAIRYTQAHGTVTVRVQTEPGHAVLTVEDNGPGIPPNARAHVLERFQRVLERGGEGSGLGLAIVQEIVQRQRGHLTLGDNPEATPPGPGTRIQVRLPLDAGQA